MIDYEHFKAKLTSDLERNTKILQTFKDKFDINPGSAFEWSAPAFAAAQRQNVCMYILEAFATWEESYKRGDKTPITVERVNIVYEHAKSEMFRRARYPVRSTSAPSNVCGQEELAAWADIVATIEERL
jgi:hypothetical protein